MQTYNGIEPKWVSRTFAIADEARITQGRPAMISTHPNGLTRDELAGERGVADVRATWDSLRAYDVAAGRRTDLEDTMGSQ